MKSNIKKILTIIIIMILCIIVFSPKILAAAVTPDQITGGNFSNDIDLDFVDDITNLLRTVGIFLAVGVMMVLGIKYMTGSLEEKATYKKTMVPYLIGCFLIFSASAVAPQIIDLFKNAKDAESVGNVALGLIRIIGSIVAVGVLMLLGIKYILGSTDEKASYKKSMLPYLVGSIMLFGAVNLTSLLYDVVAMDPAGVSDAKEYGSSHSYIDIQKEYKRAEKALEDAQNRKK